MYVFRFRFKVLGLGLGLGLPTLVPCMDVSSPNVHKPKHKTQALKTRIDFFCIYRFYLLQWVKILM